MNETGTPPDHTRAERQAFVTHRLGRLVLVTFVFTFVISRILVILIMSKRLPAQLFFHAAGTHVHHLNYGIFLLSAAGGYLIFARPTGAKLSSAAVVYAIGLALTFDEFGMWLHLGGPYWQRSSFDAVIIVAAVLALLAFGSTLHRWEARHHITASLLLVVLVIFAVAVYRSMDWANENIGAALLEMEEHGPK
jgi:hypothetical protein